MKLRKILLAVAGLALMLNASAQKSKRYYVAKPGTLVELMTEAEANEITQLTLQGKLNAVDFRHLRDEFKNLQLLDISNASISMYAGKNGTYPNRFYVYPANCIPVFFWLIEALADSVTAIFVPLGCSDSYRTKKKWETFAFIEGEPLTVNVQIGKMGSLASELLRAGFQPKDVNFLTVEGKMDEADFTLIRDYMPNLVSIDMTNSNATAIPDYTFTQKKYLLNVRLPQELRSIGQRAFSGCGRLCGTLVLPASVTAIEYGAFMGCDNLRYVLATGNKITTLGDNLFGESQGKIIYKEKQ